MHYTLHQLRVFLQVVRSRSITRAAGELHLTQPAVSVQLRNLQEQFAQPLIEVVNKKIHITDLGREIAEAAEKILSEVESINNRVHALQGRLTGKLRISVVSTGKYIAPYFIADFMKLQPGVDLYMDVTNKAQVVNGLANNEVDFAFVSVLPAHLKVEKIDLMENWLYLVGNNEIAFGKKAHDHSLLEKLPLIYREPGSGTRHVMEEYIMKNRLPVRMKMELTSNEAVKQAVIAGLGFSVMPLIGLRNELMNGQLRIIPIKGFPIRSVWHLIRLKGKKPSPVATAYLDFIRNEKQKIISEKFSWLEEFR